MSPKDEVYWYNLRQPQTKSLDQDTAVDLVVVGGGMAGLMCAQAAHKQGLSVAVLEAQFCGAGASGKSSGFITPDSELELSELITNHGQQQARELWEFVVSGCENIRKNISNFQLDCDYLIQDSLFVANTPNGEQKVRHEHAARQKLKYESKLYGADLVPHVLNSQDYYGAVRYPGTFGIVAYLYCQELKDVLAGEGVKIYERSAVIGLEGTTVLTAKHKVVGKNVVFCVDRFLPRLGIVPKDIYHAQTFLSLSKPLSGKQQRQIFPDQQLMVWDTDLIYQYFRLTGEGRLLLGGASMVYTYLKQERHLPHLIINKLQNYLKEKFPQLKIELDYLWPGLIGVSKDFLPVAGTHHELPNVYYVAGAAGLPWAAALGQYVAHKIAQNNKASSLDRYFATPREYPINYTFQSILGKPITFAVSHGITKIF